MLLLTTVTGCQIGPCGTPTVMLPVVLVASATTKIHEVIENQPEWCNTDFVLAGEVVDEQGQLVDSVDAQVIAWTAIRRDDGHATSWDRRIEHPTLASKFQFRISHAQCVEITLGGKGMEDQHLIFTYGTGIPWDVRLPVAASAHCDTSSSNPTIRNLSDGGIFYQIPEGNRPVKVSKLHLILQPQKHSDPPAGIGGA